MLKRASSLAFYGGAWVFPGGRVEPEDGDIEHALLDAARVAGVRELHEEAGLVVAPEQLVGFARWLTPPGRARRFDTFYFATRAPEAEVVLDPREADDYGWWVPARALEARERGEIELPPPTFVTLTQLATFRTVAEACETWGKRLFHYIPHPCAVEGGHVYLYEGDAGYASRDPDAPGPRHRLCAIDDTWRYEWSS